MAHKTKAALPGRQCHYTKQNPSQIITLIDQVKLTPPLAEFDLVSVLTEGGIPPLEQNQPVNGYGGIPPTGVKGYRALVHTPGYNHSTKIFVQPFASSLALRRCSSSRATLTSLLISMLAVTPIASTCSSAPSDESRGFSAAPSAWRLAISPRMAATINPALLSSGRLAASMSSMTSCGMRIEICFDLSLMVFFAMCILLIILCDSVYTKTNHIKHLICDSVRFNLNHTIIFQMVKTAKPGSVDALTGPLTTNDIQVSR